MLHVRSVLPAVWRLVLAVCAVVGVGGVVGAGPVLAADTGRAYELVSPPDKAGQSIDRQYTVQGSPDGSAVAFAAPGPFAGAPTGVSGGYYVARRSDSGWATQSIDAPQSNFDAQIATPSLYLDDALSKTFQFSSRALVPGAVEGGANLFLRDNLTGLRTFVGGSAEKEMTDQMVPATARGPLGASSDLSHVVFQTSARLLPDAGDSNVYEYVNGHLRLVNILPNGTVDTGSTMPTGARTARPVSADGSRVFFQASDGALYARDNGTVTVPVSVSRRTGDDPTVPVPAYFGGASKDGNVVYFMSLYPLTDDAVGAVFTFGNLYRYDFKTDRLTLESPSDFGDGAELLKVNEVSANGDYAYFAAWHALTPGGVDGSGNFYVSHRGVPRLIGVLADGEARGPHELSSSPSGRYLAFTSSRRLTAADNTDPACKTDQFIANPDGTCLEVYVYDAVTGALECLSCKTVDGRNRFAELGPRTSFISAYMPTLVTDDGHVFFDSGARLVAEDTNGVRDVYEWDGQRPRLISTGHGSADAILADVSPDTRNVYFFTSQRLVALDTDNAIDLYDARVGGGLASQTDLPSGSAPCEGDGCQGGLSAAEGPAVVPTATFAGGGDLSQVTPKEPSGTSKLGVSGPRSVRGSSVVLRVKVAGAGKISVSGSRLVTVNKAVKGAGSYTVSVRLAASAKRALRRSKSLKVPVRVTFAPRSGARSSGTINVTFKTEVNR